VDRQSNPSRSATTRATVDFPVFEVPPISTTLTPFTPRTPPAMAGLRLPENPSAQVRGGVEM